MTTKDWIIMLVPIAVNGVCLFLFQQLISRRFQQNEKKTDYRQEILKELLRLLKEFYETFRAIRYTTQLPQDKFDFATTWNLTVEQIQKILIYFDTHRMALISLEKVHSRCIAKYDCLIGVLRNEAIPHDGGFIITEKCNKDFSDEYLEMDKLIKEYLEECEKQILQFR